MAADPGRDRPARHALTLRHGWRRTRHQGGRRRAARQPRASRSPSSSASSSPARRRCWPSRSTRSPTRATRACCCSAAGGPRKAADESHPFGYGRERYFWAFVVALVLFSLGGAFAIFEGIEKIRHPHELESAGGGHRHPRWSRSLLETFSFRTAIVEANKVRGDAGWWQFIRRSKNPELPGRAARGPRRRWSACVLALGRRRAPRSSPTTRCGTASARCRSASCSR